MEEKYKNLKHYISPEEWNYLKKAEHVDSLTLEDKNMIQRLPNELKFAAASLLLKKSDRRYEEQIRNHLKDVIFHSFQPRELYIDKKEIGFKFPRQWFRTEDQNSDTSSNLYNLNFLFELYELHNSRKAYEEYNENLYYWDIAHPALKQRISIAPQISKQLEKECFEDKSKSLINVLVPELLERCGVFIGGQRLENGSFILYISPGHNLEEALRAYIDETLK
jgi:hypothetical protein